MTRYDAVVLAGGTATRLGGVDKARLEVGGQALLDRVLAAVTTADRKACVGPPRDTATTVTWCREQPPGGGPVAALAAAMQHVRAEIVVLLAADLPLVDAATVESLVGAVGDQDGAVAVDGAGRVQPLLAAYRRVALAQALAALPTVAGASMRDLIAPLVLRRVPVGLAALDCDTAEDLAAARAAAGGGVAVSTLDDWVALLGAELGVELPVDVPGLLDLARNAAHSVDRPAAPLTTFLVGYAAAQAGGGAEAVDDAVRRARLLAVDWPAKVSGRGG